MTSSKVQFDDTTVERIRASAEFEPALDSQLTIKVFFVKKRRILDQTDQFRLKTVDHGMNVTWFCILIWLICTFGKI